jgi:hypothetical protein
MNKFMLVITLLFSLSAYAMEIPGPEGVTIELNDDPPHKLIRLRAIGESDIPIGDRKDVQRATKVATLKAKAAIAKYLGEDIKTEEAVQQISESIQQSNGQVSTVSRQDVERLIETICDSSSAFMKGVIILEQQVDPANKRVIVTVGTSEKTQKAADQVRQSLNTNSIYRSMNSKIQPAEVEFGAAGQEIRRNDNYDDF